MARWGGDVDAVAGDISSIHPQHRKETSLVLLVIFTLVWLHYVSSVHKTQVIVHTCVTARSPRPHLFLQIDHAVTHMHHKFCIVDSHLLMNGR